MAHIDDLRNLEEIVKKMDDVIREVIYNDTKYETLKTQTAEYDFLMDMIAHVFPLFRQCCVGIHLADSYKARHACFYTMDYLLHIVIELLEVTKEKLLDVYPNLTEFFALGQEMENALRECNLTFG